MNTTSKLFFISCLCAGTILSAAPASAQNYNPARPAIVYSGADERDGDWEVTLGAGAMVTPEYEGGEDYEIVPVPYIDVNYRDRVTFNPFDGARVNILKSDHLVAGAGLGFDFGRDEDDADRLEGLGDIDATIEGQLFARYNWRAFNAELALSQDLGDGHEGYLVEAELGYGIPLPQYSTFTRLSVTTSYAGDDYMESFFGVNNAQSARSGLSEFDAEAGFKDVSLNSFTSYRFTENWSLNGLLQYKQLLGDAADSPVVEEEGQLTGGAFVTYRF